MIGEATTQESIQNSGLWEDAAPVELKFHQWNTKENESGSRVMAEIKREGQN